MSCCATCLALGYDRYIVSADGSCLPLSAMSLKLVRWGVALDVLEKAWNVVEG